MFTSKDKLVKAQRRNVIEARKNAIVQLCPNLREKIDLKVSFALLVRLAEATFISVFYHLIIIACVMCNAIMAMMVLSCPGD